MGGLHSGRKRTHTCIDECIVIDLARLKKLNLLQPGHYPMLAPKYLITNYHQKREYTHEFDLYMTETHLTLSYQVRREGSKQHSDHTHTLLLTSTPCHYGGTRCWFLAPCCGQRVRVLYINPKRGTLEEMTPQCRTCLDLHYASQLSSSIERQKTYERYLLTNYGYKWASWSYEWELQEHYLPMTPELERRKMQSLYDQQLKMLILLMRLNRRYLRIHQRALDSLKSEEDTIYYTRHLLQEWGVGHVQRVMEQLHKPEKRIRVRDILADWIRQGEKSHALLDFASLVEQKKELEAELQALKVA